MYNRFRRRYCMYCNDNQVLEDVCDNISNDDNNCCNMDDCYMNDYDCGCGFDEESSVFPTNPMLAQSYVPIQTFPELVSPYEPCQSMEFINYLKRRNTIGEGCNG